MKLVLFDLDDTLFDFSRTWDIVLKRMFAEHTVTRVYETEAFFEAFQRKSDELYALYEQRICTIEEYRCRRLIETLKDYGCEMSTSQAMAFNLEFVRQYLDSLEPDKKVQDLLHKLEESYLLGIITNGPHDMQEAKLEKLGLKRFFQADRVWISNAVGVAKPDPRIYQMALDHFGVSPEDALFVGDSWPADVAGPIRIGMQAVWLNKYGKEPGRNAVPRAIIKELHELIDLLS
ncbi:HAD family hydrolase [Paenibacillus hexagrammi]|uniref:HAD family hydrolase n=1 Tax=Paenibacillus hexagrammi TaxID=2908839 RepID=A0ABY3SN88_9BACL|nr:HAD family hydrolase [Paenibacillus sp. YPD9-1]UJF34704.1 HAD family hydrolase [Paenibacillus sp. YPD9-1]